MLVSGPPTHQPAIQGPAASPTVHDDPIPGDVAKYLSRFLARQGLEPGSVEDLLTALRADLGTGQPTARRVYDALVAAATARAGGRVEKLVAEIARLASIPVAPHPTED